MVYNERNKFEKAVEVLKKAIKVKGGDLFSHYLLGNTYLDKGDYSNAIKEFNKAVEIDSKDVYSWNPSGFSLQIIGRV